MMLILFFSTLPWLVACLIRWKYRERVDWWHCIPYSCFSFLCVIVTLYLTRYDLPPQRTITFCLLFILLLVTQTDMWIGLVPNVCTYSGTLVLLSCQFFSVPDQMSVIVIRFLFMLMLLSILVKWTGCMGWGDVKLIAMSAVVIDYYLLVIAVWLASISALITLAVDRMCAHRSWDWELTLPFAPHLAMGMFLSYLFGYQWFGYLLTLFF